MPAFLDKHIDNLILLIVEYTPRVIMSLLILLFGLWLITRIAKLADKAMIRRNLEVSLRTFLASLLSIGLKIILIVTVAGMIGIGTASFVTILGAAGLAIGLALQGSLSNFAGGVLILIFKPFKVGDSIEAGGQTGAVIEIQIFNTILLTGEHKTVILPNGPLSNGTIVNISRYGDLRVEIELNITSENDLSFVKQVIQDVIKQNEKILVIPETKILIGKMTDGAITIIVRPYCYFKDSSVLTSELYAEFKSAFEKNKIKLPARQR
ncbi:MAG: mechanosensitive ion channel [Bacteroidota bacterium]|nr:mechanosensitive ion channel [Bacteroidota bacterium]MDP3146351.1 mechanosensitive ion channel [Bacteroidota bacterium]MDP3556357.1 mechanosensitive ion channel [Bacteroidota bacterium]